MVLALYYCISWNSKADTIYPIYQQKKMIWKKLQKNKTHVISDLK